jgi:hypothetical protein
MANWKHRKSGLEEFIGGLGIFAVCALLFAFHVAPGWIFFPGLFMGAFPMVKGLRLMVRERENRRLEIQEKGEARERSTQRAVLEIASRNRGVVTPVALAMSANMAIEQADSFLQDMAARGYAEMNVRDNGTIEYVINEFRP